MLEGKHLSFFSGTERLPPVNVGIQSLFYLVTQDKFGNQVNPDDTVIRSFSVQVLQCGLRFPLDTLPDSPSLAQILNTTNKDCKCDAKYLDNGVFEVRCTPYCPGIGSFCVSITGSDGRTVSSQLHEGHLEVKTGPPSPLHSRIQYDSTNVKVNKTYSLKLYLFDKYYNSVQPSKSDFWRIVHIIVLADNSNNIDFSVAKADIGSFFVLRFVAKSTARQYIVEITVDGVRVPQTPLVISVDNRRHEVEQKLSALYASLQSHRKQGLPTQIVERRHILNSGLRILSSDKISYCLRVRFDDERGMDLGGLSK